MAPIDPFPSTSTSASYAAVRRGEVDAGKVFVFHGTIPKILQIGNGRERRGTVGKRRDAATCPRTISCTFLQNAIEKRSGRSAAELVIVK